MNDQSLLDTIYLPGDDCALDALNLKVDEIAAFGLTFICWVTKTCVTFSTLGESHSKVLLSLYCHRIKSPLSIRI